MNIEGYQVERKLAVTDDISTYIAQDCIGNQYFMRMINKKSLSQEVMFLWFQYYDMYKTCIANYKFLPRVISISTYKNTVYTLFSYERGEFLQDVNQLSSSQDGQLLDAVSHIHRKGLIHGNISPENIWIRENGKILLFGALEKYIFYPEKQEIISIQDDSDQVNKLLKQ